MASIDDSQRLGSRNGYDNTSPTNQINFLVNQKNRKDIQTNLVARIDSCQSQEEQTGAKTVAITPLISQTDTEGTALEMVSIPNLPHERYQAGIAAFIVDPVPGDIVQVSINKNDITNINDQTTAPVNAGSNRQFSQADAVIGGAIHTKTPEVYIVLRQDKTIKERGPEGIRVETDKTLDEQALENRLINIGKDRQETIGANSTQDIKGNESVTIGGAHSLDIKGNSSITIGGALNTQVSNTITINGNSTITIGAGGSISINAGAPISISAPSITFDTPIASFNGSVTIAGGLSQGGGMRAARSSNTAVFYNDLHTRGTVTADTDVVGSGISLKSHVHGGVQGGPGTTTGPQ